VVYIITIIVPKHNIIISDESTVGAVGSWHRALDLFFEQNTFITLSRLEMKFRLVAYGVQTYINDYIIVYTVMTHDH